jgi:hypothetical protein
MTLAKIVKWVLADYWIGTGDEILACLPETDRIILFL